VTVPTDESERAVKRGLPAPGTHISVQSCRGRVPRRTGTVVEVHAFEGVSQGRVVRVRWDDDGSVSCLVPGTDIEFIGA